MQKHRLFGALAVTLVLGVLSGPAAQAIPYWQIDETSGSIFPDLSIIGGDAVFYTITNNHPSQSIDSFVVGFNEINGTSPLPAVLNGSGYLLGNAPGWQGAILMETSWDQAIAALDNQSAQTFFGLTWAEFQALDAVSTTDAVVFNRGSGTDLLLPNTIVGATFLSPTDPYFGVTFALPGSPAAVKMNGGGVFGGPVGQNNPFPIPEATIFWMVALGCLCVLRRYRKA